MPGKRNRGKAKRNTTDTKPKAKEEPKAYSTVNYSEEAVYNESYIDFYEQGYADIHLRYDAYKPFQTYNLTFFSETYKFEIYQKQNKFYQMKTIPFTQYEELPPVLIERVKTLEKIKASAKSEEDLKNSDYYAILACIHQYMAGNYYQYVFFNKTERQNEQSLLRDYSFVQEQYIKAGANPIIQPLPIPEIILPKDDKEFNQVNFDLINKIKDLEIQLNQSEKLREQLVNENNDIKAQLSEQKSQFELQLNNQKQDYEKELQNKSKELEIQLSNKANEYESKINSQSKEIQELNLSRSGQAKEIEKLNLSKNQQAKEIQELNLFKSEQAKEIQSLNEKISELQTNVATQPHKNDSIEILDEESINSLEKIEEIGYGGSGKVYKVFKKLIYALKVMNTMNASHENLQHFITEYEIMNMLHHPNILKTFGIFFSGLNNPPSFLLEFCPNNLDQAIKSKNLTKVQIVTSIFQIAEGMRYVHYQKVIHRDLKPSNILIATDGTIKIADFGISKLMNAEDISMTIGIGTQKFMAPELINEEEKYNEKVDIYSFGVLMFFILNDGKMPKITVTQVGIGKKADIPSEFTDFSRNLISSCWNFNPNDRPSFKNICEQLEQNARKIMNLPDTECDDIVEFMKEHRKKIPFFKD